MSIPAAMLVVLGIVLLGRILAGPWESDERDISQAMRDWDAE